MCYTNCKHENYNGECCKRGKLIDVDCHCFEGFECKICFELKGEYEESEDENVCKECFE